MDELPGKSNYFIGADPKQWRTDIPTYAKVKFAAVYPGVDVVYYGAQGRQLEYDFVVAPGADPKAIKLSFEGADKIEVDEQGDLALSLSGKELRLRKPVVYQERDGARQEIAGSYTLSGEREVGFEIAAYDVARPLVIDPVLAYSTYLGGSGWELADGVALDAQNNFYVVGWGGSNDLNVTPNAYQKSLKGGTDIFIWKFRALIAGGTLDYLTYLGGEVKSCATNPPDAESTVNHGIAVESQGDIIYVTGQTDSTDFPPNNLGQLNGCLTAFVTKLRINQANTQLVYSRFLGGSSGGAGRAIAVDINGNAYVTGGSFGAFQSTSGLPTCSDTGAFVVKWRPGTERLPGVESV